MKVTTLFSTLSILAASTLANAFSLSDVKKGANSGSIVPGRYIVEFDSNAHLSSANLKRDANPHEYIYRQLEARDTPYTVHQEYSSDLFVGASISLGSDEDLSTLISITGVINLRPVHLLSLPAKSFDVTNTQWPTPAQAGSATNGTARAPTVAAPQVTTTTKCTGKGKKQTCTTQTITVTATASSTASAKPTTGFSPLSQIQVDQVQASGNKGKGVKIGVIDSGVDYRRVPLGGCFGAGCKIAGGYDFVGDNFTGSNDPVPDDDPYDDCYGHGTIVAGAIGADDNEYNVPGAAPEATQYAYRVFSCSGATTDDIAFQAMQRAYNDNMDIINLSFGEATGWTESMLSVLAARLVASGTVVVASAGNRGQVGAFFTSAPAAAKGVISVGSSDNSIYPAHLATVSTGHAPITYFNFQAFRTGTHALYAYTTDPAVPDDGCVTPAGAPDLSPYILVVRRGGCSLSQKAKNAYLQGAAGILVVNTPNTAPTYQTFPLIDFAMVGYEDGNYLISQANTPTTASNTTLTFSFNPTAFPNVWTGNSTSYFSQIGPSNDLNLSPTVLAPGSNIIGIYPSALGNFTFVQGTSFSAPYVAGAAALYLSAKGVNNVSPKDVLTALENTAEPLAVSPSDSSLETIAAQGGGRLNIAEAINPGAIISPSEILLNDSAYFASVQYLTIKNPSWWSWTTFKLKNVPAGTALAYQTGLNQSNDEPIPQVPNAASVKFSQSSVWLWPGGTTVVIMQFTAPTGLDPKTFPIYSGYIQVTGGSTTTQVPYLGVAAKMKDMPVLDPTPYYLGMNTPTILDASGKVQTGTASYTFSGSDYPTVLYRLVGGTPLLLIDLIDAAANLTFTPNYNSRKRSVAEVNVEVEKRSSLEARRSKSTGDQTRSSSNGKSAALLSLWCQLTNWRGQGCAASGGAGGNGGNTFAKVPIIGNVYQAAYIPRNTDNADGAGTDYSQFELSAATFANGTAIPNGTYKFLMRTLHITGDRTNEADYEAWVSAPFTVAK
ncbi:hypothetical protein CI109_101871 [Kwoniella shandongensis]|uniref:Uncharacterized protein n=1 Tax=Kwoniella shandongensis TaxID=1734106 RepID=A0A5M6BNZ8_9TREE|nr:uncharacterized protein CI109_007051 [Kwoniella shandongensis]KAA5524616.1 hypothetical protein CI109_007051 [Kwoniella shandongensis]